MKTFEESLDSYIERGAEEFVCTYGDNNDHVYNERLKMAHDECASSLKPIVLKLYEALQKIQSGEEEIEIAPDCKINRFSRVDMCAIADLTLSEISHMLEGGSK